MSRYTLTLVGFLLMAGVGIFLGIEIATRGIEQIHGPLDYSYNQPGGGGEASRAAVDRMSSVPSIPTVTPQSTPVVWSATTGAANTVVPPIGAGSPAWTGDSNVNRIGNGIGDLLQGAAHQTIRLVVGVFDGLIN